MTLYDQGTRAGHQSRTPSISWKSRQPRARWLLIEVIVQQIEKPGKMAADGGDRLSLIVPRNESASVGRCEPVSSRCLCERLPWYGSKM